MDRPWTGAGLKYAELRPADVPSLLVQRVACIGAFPTLDQRFLGYLIGQPGVHAPMFWACRRVRRCRTLASKQIQEFEFARPPPRDQRAIGEVLGALDDKIGRQRGAGAGIASGLAEARYTELVASTAGLLPVGNLIELKYGKALPAAERLAGKYPVYGSGGVGQHS